MAVFECRSDGGSLLYSQNQQGDNELRLVEHFE